MFLGFLSIDECADDKSTIPLSKGGQYYASDIYYMDQPYSDT